MAGSPSLVLEDVASLLDLSQHLNEMPADPAARKHRLLEELCRVVPADSGLAVIMQWSGRTSVPTLSPVIHTGMGSKPELPPPLAPLAADESLTGVVRRRAAMPLLNRDIGAQGRCDVATVRAKLAHAQSDQWLYSLVPLAGNELIACVALRRAGSERFVRRDCNLVHVFHMQAHWLYRQDLALASPRAKALSRRQWETLQYLLAGYAEKQIASRMDVSRNTVHHYVKILYRHFDVSTRGELLARWVKQR